jgi:hypothetical protein
MCSSCCCCCCATAQLLAQLIVEISELVGVKAVVVVVVDLLALLPLLLLREHAGRRAAPRIAPAGTCLVMTIGCERTTTTATTAPNVTTAPSVTGVTRISRITRATGIPRVARVTRVASPTRTKRAHLVSPRRGCVVGCIVGCIVVCTTSASGRRFQDSLDDIFLQKRHRLMDDLFSLSSFQGLPGFLRVFRVLRDQVTHLGVMGVGGGILAPSLPALVVHQHFVDWYGNCITRKLVDGSPLGKL